MRELVRDHDRLIHIIEAIDRILENAQGITLGELENDSLKFYGIVKNIEIIGEATFKLTKAFRAQHSLTPWDAISRMRHVLVHDYYQIDVEQVWNVMRNDLAPLKEQINDYINNTDWEEWEKNDNAISESAVRKSLIQTATRMKNDGLTNQQIMRYTGLSIDEIEDL